eukprot:1770696-Pyramimonas_sp.AAC.3
MLASLEDEIFKAHSMNGMVSMLENILPEELKYENLVALSNLERVVRRNTYEMQLVWWLNY